MGNFSSCTAGFDPLSAPLPPAHTPHVARVLLVDGSMLKFKAPLRVIKLLLQYPNHVICPLESLAPGLHSLSSLPPDEKLQLGRLYLLLPFKTNAQESCSKNKQGNMQQKGEDANKSFSNISMQGKKERTRLLPGHKSDVGLTSCAKFHKKGGVGSHGYAGKLQPSSLVKQAASAGDHMDTKKVPGKCSSAGTVLRSEVNLQECAGLGKGGDVGAHCRRRSAATGGYGKHAERRGRREMQSKSMDVTKQGQCGRKCACDVVNHGVSPLCDTPELQRAYHSFLLQRSCSWTPRLQPILERR